MKKTPATEPYFYIFPGADEDFAASIAQALASLAGSDHVIKIYDEKPDKETSK